jgi:hypothetical protein
MVLWGSAVLRAGTIRGAISCSLCPAPCPISGRFRGWVQVNTLEHAGAIWLATGISLALEIQRFGNSGELPCSLVKIKFKFRFDTLTVVAC